MQVYAKRIAFFQNNLNVFLQGCRKAITHVIGGDGKQLVPPVYQYGRL
jgi:hypothetical protein